jgi:hypothetical protein
MGPRNGYKDMLDNVVSPITCVSMNHQNQLEQMANGAMFATPICYPHHRRVTECYAPASFTSILLLLPYPCLQIRSRTSRKLVPRVLFSFGSELCILLLPLFPFTTITFAARLCGLLCNALFCFISWLNC